MLSPRGITAGRPAKALRRKAPDTRRRRLMALAMLLAAHPALKGDLFSPARCAHARLALMPDLRAKGDTIHAAFRDLRLALEASRDDI